LIACGKANSKPNNDTNNSIAAVQLCYAAQPLCHWGSPLNHHGSSLLLVGRPLGSLPRLRQCKSPY
jgi:hypothetical protein